MMQNNDKIIPAGCLVFLNSMNLQNCLVAVLCSLPEIRRALHLNEHGDIRVQMLHTWQIREGDLDLPPGTPLTPAAIEACGYRLLFEPEGGVPTVLSKAMRERKETNLLRYLMHVSNLKHNSDFAWLNWYIKGVLKNVLGGQELCDGGSIPESRREQTPQTTRDLRTLLDYLENQTSTKHKGNDAEAARKRTQAWEFALRVVSASLQTARRLFTLHADQEKPVPNIKFTEVFMPDMYYPLLNSEDQTRLEECFRQRNHLFRAAEEKLRTKKLKSKFVGFTGVQDGNGTSLIEMPLLNGKGKIRTAIALAHFTAAQDGAEAYLYSSVVRFGINNHFKQTKHALKGAPVMMVRFHGPGTFFAQTDTGDNRALDPTALVVASRQVEIRHRSDLTPTEKRVLKANIALLSERGAPEYAPGKKSHIIFGSNGLTWGNTYGEGQPAIRGGSRVNAELIKAMSVALNNLRVTE